MGASDDTQTTSSTSSTAPTNPDVVAATSKLAKGISTAYDKGPQVFNQSTFAGAGGTTQDAWQKALQAANIPGYDANVSGAVDSLGKTASGAYVGSTDPKFEAALDRASNGLTADVNASIGADGRYGSNVHTQALTDQVGALRTNAELGNLQQQKADQLAALQALPGAFSAKQLPASTVGAVGAAMDANSQGNLTGQYDLATRQGNAWTDLLAKLTSAAGGNAANSGSVTNNSTTSPTTPWWQGLISTVGSLA